MYSDFLELPSKDCFPFSDQLLCFDISKLNEFDNHINFDNIYDSYYSSSIQYNTNFELSENCKNLSFSELFDSELFSTDENEDCSLKLKIEKEEELNPCFSPDNLQATSEEHNLVKVDENISSSLLPNNFTPKIGINRTLIKSTENCDINHFIYNPFQETKDLGVKHTSVLHFFKCEPENNESTEETTVDMEVKPCYPSDSLQDNTMVCSLIKSKDDVTSSSLKNSFQKYGKMSKTTIKTVKNDECNEILSTDEMSVNNKSPIMKFEPMEINDTINQNIEVRENPISSYNSANTLIDNHKVRSKENNVSKLPNILISKRKSIHKSSKKPIETYDVKLVEKNEILDIHQKSVYDKIPIKIKSEPVEINDTINQNIEMKEKTIPSDNLANTLINNHKMKSKKDNVSKLPNILISKRQSVHKGSKKSIKTYDAKLVAKSEVIGIDQMPVHDKIPIIKIKSEPMEIDDIINQNIEMRVKSFSSDNSKNTLITNHSMESQEGNVLCSLPKKFISKRQSNRKASKKTVKNYNEKRVIKNEVIDIDQMSDYDKIPIIKIKSEPVDINDTINQNFEMREKPFFSDNSKNILITNHSMESKEGNVLSSLPKKFISKRQSVLKASKKPIKNYDLKHVTKNEAISIDQRSAYGKIPITKIKSEPVDINDTINQNIQIRVKPFSYDNSANTLINNHGIKPKESNVVFSLSNGLISKRQSVHKASKKPIKNDDVKHIAKNEIISIDQMSAYGKIPIKKIKSEPMEIDDTINQNIEMRVKPFSSDTPADTLINNHRIKSKESNVLVSLSNGLISKCQSVHKASKKPIKNYAKLVAKSEVLGIGQMPVHDKIPIIKIKSEPMEIDDTINQNIEMKVKPFSSDYDSLKRKKDSVSPSLLNKSISKRPDKASNQTIIDQDKHITNNNCDKELENIKKKLVNNKTLLKVELPNIRETINQNNDMKVESYCLNEKLPKMMIDNHSFVKIKDNVLSSLPQNVINRRGTHKMSMKNDEDERCDVQNMNNNFCKTSVGHLSSNVKITTVKSEFHDIDDAVEQNIVKINEQDSEKNPNNICKEVKHLNNLDIENVKVINIKKENIVPNTTSLKNDIISQTCTINNGTNLETEKKKISWEEFRAKRGKMGLLNNLENNEAPVANDKLEAIIKEFDQNTAEHFIGQKRKIEEPNSIVQEISTEDQELQKKRMKIEYIKQLLPSSFASEIAKTSSLMKGHLLENIENENTLDDSIMSNDKTQGKYSDIHDDLGYPTKGDKYKKKNLQSRVYSSRHNSSRSNCNKTWSLSSSNSDDYYNQGEIDTLQHAGQYGQNTRKMVSRSKFVDQKKVVYVGQIPIKYGKRYLYNRFKMFGKIQSLTLHKKPDFRVYYAFVTYSEKSEAERAISHGNNDKTQVQLDIRFGERKQTQNPYYDLDDEWLTDWYTYKLPEEVVKSPTPEKVSFEEELQEFYKLAQIKKQNQVNPSQVS